jgi:DNA-directed RNA polymerase specialized sigma24 family protein
VAVRAYPQLPAGANVEAWLVTIAYRRALDAGRPSGAADGIKTLRRIYPRDDTL